MVTVLELYKPILIGNAIDKYVNGYQFPYEVTKENANIEYDGVGIRKIVKAEKEDSEYWRLVSHEGKYYLIRGLSMQDLNLLEQAELEETRCSLKIQMEH